MKRICVFCGSSPGAKPEYVQAAKQLGNALVDKNIGLVYGGGSLGLMGVIGNAVLEQGGEVIGVIPRDLAEKKVALTKLPDLRIVDSMHQRKAMMAELAGAFIALPGGLGTIEEFFEAVTWTQLGVHKKPCGLLNVGQFFDKLIDFLDYVVEQQFIKVEHRSMILVDKSPETLLKKIKGFQPPNVDKAAWALSLANNESKHPMQTKPPRTLP